MPKGALLHAHLDATVNAKFLLKLALKEPALHVKIAATITSGNAVANLPEFRALPRDQFPSDVVASLTDSAYIPGTWVSLTRARETFAEELGGPDGFDAWVIGSMMINPTEAYKTHNTITKVDSPSLALLQESYVHRYGKSSTVCSLSPRYVVGYSATIGTIIDHVQGLIRYAPIFPEYIREFFRTSIEDGISYIEARINFLYKYVSESHTLLVFDYGWWQIYGWGGWPRERPPPQLAYYI